MSLNSRSSLKKNQWCKGPKIDGKVTSLNVEVHSNVEKSAMKNSPEDFQTFSQ